MTRSAPRPQPITVLDLFAGCGGLTEGFHQFRPDGGEDRPVFRTVGAVEWDTAAAASYEMNFGARSPRLSTGVEPARVYCEDIVGWIPSGLGAIDVVVGGPPCQGFSGLNRDKVKAERNQLWQEFIRVVEHVQPKVFVIENVDRFVRSPEFADLQDRVRSGALKNYVLVDPPGAGDESTPSRARGYLLNSADYGSPQARRRAIVIGVRTNAGVEPTRFRYPAPTHARAATALSGDAQGSLDGIPGLVSWLTVDAVFERSARIPLTAINLPDRDPVVGKIVGPYRTTDLHITRAPEPISLARYRAIPPKGNRKDLRGRYLLTTTAGGATELLKKVTEFRDGQGELAVEGDYEVIDGNGPGTRISVKLSDRPVPRDVSRSGRHRSETFVVRVDRGGKETDGRLEYLSTASWDSHDAGSADVMGRLRLGDPSVTVRTEFFKPEKGRYLHPTEDRPITHYEAAKLQGFPDDFLWCGSKTEIARQIGNAVPIPLGRSIARSIYDYLREPTAQR
ncbi:DNA cytosine methyltransferase [Isoptericola sp. NPDC056134]|uniref:DNA cytosine methyltransferase n=1 Tax=Isoptericola sp. NPDC056134 TaxID=3345723 RepID=UPI0035ED688B